MIGDFIKKTKMSTKIVAIDNKSRGWWELKTAWHIRFRLAHKPTERCGSDSFSVCVSYVCVAWKFSFLYKSMNNTNDCLLRCIGYYN